VVSTDVTLKAMPAYPGCIDANLWPGGYGELKAGGTIFIECA
jgi:hypothetical protein